MRFRVLTYNIHKGIGGLDRKYRPERIVETIAHYEPDFVLLQEVDDGVPRSRNHRQVDLIADRLGLEHRAFQSNVRLRQGTYGNATLSRHPLDAPLHVDLTIPLKKRRRALVVRAHVRCAGHTRSVVIANVHLGLAGFERVLQLRKLLMHHAVHGIHRATPALIAGDFNDVWGSLGSRVLEPAGFQPALGNVRTFPAAYPLRPLDRVFFRGDLALHGGFGGHTNLARQASDHLPIIADLELTGI